MGENYFKTVAASVLFIIFFLHPNDCTPQDDEVTKDSGPTSPASNVEDTTPTPSEPESEEGTSVNPSTNAVEDTTPMPIEPEPEEVTSAKPEEHSTPNENEKRTHHRQPPKANVKQARHHAMIKGDMASIASPILVEGVDALTNLLSEDTFGGPHADHGPSIRKQLMLRGPRQAPQSPVNGQAATIKSPAPNPAVAVPPPPMPPAVGPPALGPPAVAQPPFMPPAVAQPPFMPPAAAAPPRMPPALPNGPPPNGLPPNGPPAVGPPARPGGGANYPFVPSQGKTVNIYL
ncbi:uncharacterized protein ACN427_000290 [Glossina fuscipes fuscipes]